MIHATSTTQIPNRTLEQRSSAADHAQKSLPEFEVDGAEILRRDLMTSLPFLASDLCALAVAFLVVASVHFAIPSLTGGLSLGILLANCVLIPLTFAVFELYPAVAILPAIEVKRQLQAIVIIISEIAILSVFWGTPSDKPFFLIDMLTFGAVLAPIVTSFRVATRTLCSRFDWWKQPTYLLASNVEKRRWYECIESNPDLGLRIAETGTPCRAIVTESGAAELGYAPEDLLLLFPRVNFVSSVEPDASETKACQMRILTGRSLKNRLLLPQYHVCKRIFDLTLILLSLPLLLPAVAVVAMLVKTTSPGPIFFSQERPGKKGARFRTWKFRTMVIDAEQRLEEVLASDPEKRAEWDRHQKLRVDPRVTGIGRLLRATSMDELPQLWNVVCGEMSLVGPRPILVSQIPSYGSIYHLYTSVLPGLTGLWQTSGRNNTTHDARRAFDAHYVKNWSLWYDVYLLIRTVRTIITREGAY